MSGDRAATPPAARRSAWRAAARPLGRRTLLTGGSALGLLFAATHATGLARPARLDTTPFTLGVASGDPAPDGMVLWTRLAPHPLDGDGGGMPPVPVAVEWRIAADERFGSVLRSGTVDALPALAHSVHVELTGLEPDRWYWYQFRAGGWESPVGRTRTTPAAAAATERLRFAFASCQNWEQGYYTAHQHLAEEDLDLVVFLGDYIYEGGGRDGRVRRHDGPEPVTLAGYRARHALYRTDPHLQRVHARFPWVATWDDHEVVNNYAGGHGRPFEPPGAFLTRRAAAYQAYYEHLPLRRASTPRGPDMDIYRRVAFGDLATFHVLDTRQYRTPQPCGDGLRPRCPEVFDPRATLLGPEQERWLFDGLAASTATWNLLAQQVMLAEVDRLLGPEAAVFMDQWAGYAVERDRLLAFLHERRPSNPVVITGDIHSTWVADLALVPRDPGSPLVGTELVGTSISSGGDGSDSTRGVDAIRAENPLVRFFNNQRGYIRCELTPAACRADVRVVAAVTRPEAPITTRASFVVEAGRPGVLPA